MNIWERAILNVQKGSKKVTVIAATFSDRMKAELAIIRLRLRIDEIQSRIDDLHRMIGRKVVELMNRETIPKTTEQLLKEEEIVSAMTELKDREQEIADLRMSLKTIHDDVKTTEKQTEETLV